MNEIHKIIENHRATHDQTELSIEGEEFDGSNGPNFCLIPDLFFDSILVEYKLTRIETLVLIYLYRKVWHEENVYIDYGISPLMSHTELVKKLSVDREEAYQAIRKLEEYGFIQTIRSGQYFVRRYFTTDNDEFYGQSYDELLE